MKKFLTLAVLLTLLISCSNEQETQFNEQTNQITKKSNLRNLYDGMFVSSTYKSLESAITVYLNKMNYTGNYNDLSSKGYILDWISKNIQKTTFSNFNEAQSGYQNLENLQANVLSQNSLFFSTLQGSSPGSLTGFNPVITPIEGTLSCIDKCAFAHDNCMKGAQMEYNDQMEKSWILGFIGMDTAHQLLCEFIKFSHGKECDRAAGLCAIACNNP